MPPDAVCQVARQVARLEVSAPRRRLHVLDVGPRRRPDDVEQRPQLLPRELGAGAVVAFTADSAQALLRDGVSAHAKPCKVAHHHVWLVCDRLHDRS